MKWPIILYGTVLCLAAASVQAEDRPALGIRMDDAASAKSGAGVVVDSVVPGGPAARAGLLAGDRISAIDDQPVKTSADVIKLISGSSVNKQVTVDVTRGAWRASLMVTLGKADQVFRPQPVVQTMNPYCSHCQSSCQYGSRGRCRRFFNWSNDDDSGGDDIPFIDGSE